MAQVKQSPAPCWRTAILGLTLAVSLYGIDPIIDQIEPEPPEKSWIPKLDLQIDEEALRGKIQTKLLESLHPKGNWTVPGSSILTPTAYGAEWTDLFLGLGVQTRARFNTLPNSTFHAGFGIGNAEILGLETAFTSYGTIRNGPPYTIGGVSFKLHRFFSGLELAAAIGYENAIVWGAPDSGQSYFGVVSKYFTLRKDPGQFFSLLTLHGGVGDGRFRLQRDVRKKRRPTNIFGSAGLRILEPLSLILEWSGSDISLGLSIAPFEKFPLVIGISTVDLAQIAGDGTRQILTLSLGGSWE